MENYFFIYYIVCIIWYLAFIGLTVYLYYNESKPYEAKFNEEFYTKIPSNLNPGELSYLMYKKIIPEVFTSTILVLVKKEVLTLKRHKGHFSLILNQNDVRISPSQKAVLDMLIKDMGDGEQVSFEQIEKYCNSNQNCSEFLMNYQLWVKMMIKESHKKNFYEQKLEYNQVKFLRTSGIILFILNIICGYHDLLGYFIIVPAFFIVLYFYKIFKRTKQASEDYSKWLAFKRYLGNINDFKYEKSDISNYIIYGLVLKMPELEKDLTDFICVERLNQLINHNIVMASLKGNRSIKF